MPAKKKIEPVVAAKPVAKKAVVKKTVIAKAEAPKAPAPVVTAPAVKAPAAKPAPVKKAAPIVDKKPASVLSPEERYQRVQTEAYFIAEKDSFKSDSHSYWTAAELKVASELA